MADKKKAWVTPKISDLDDLRNTESKFLPTLPEGPYPTKDGGTTPGGS